MKLAKDYTQAYGYQGDSMTPSEQVSAGYAEGERWAREDYKEVGAFNNPFKKGTYQYNGYACAESKQFRINLDNSHYQQEPY